MGLPILEEKKQISAKPQAIFSHLSPLSEHPGAAFRDALASVVSLPGGY
jgi:hypothetical protein